MHSEVTKPDELTHIIERAVNEHTRNRVEELMKECIEEFKIKLNTIKIEMSADIVARVWQGMGFHGENEIVLRIPMPIR